MDWITLTQPLRCDEKELSENDFNRNQFQRDYDRIIFLSAFRRLNGKTQIFPFPESDFIHTRLTHSLESSSVGRSLGNAVQTKLIEKGMLPDDHSFHFSSIVGAACLAHDIGNPPFGHSGERAIAEYFQSTEGQQVLVGLAEEQKADFEHFEGNAMGFHLLTWSNPQKTAIRGGQRLTYPTLAAYTKYPQQAGMMNNETKSGIFAADIDSYQDIAESLGIPQKVNGKGWYRHPLALLTEAADDICYLIMDFEDGVKYNLVSYELAEKLLKKICDEGEVGYEKLDKIIYPQEKIAYLRAKAISSLVNQTADHFVLRESEILKTSFQESLIKYIASADTMKDVRKISQERIYTYKPVLEIEAAGFQVIPGLLSNFLAGLRDLKEQKKHSNRTIQKLIPKEYRTENSNKYTAILEITAYVAGMTDAFAVDTYRKLQGIKIPNY